MGGGTVPDLAEAMARAAGGMADHGAAREAVERLARLGLTGSTDDGVVPAPTGAGLLAVEVALVMAEALSPAVAPQPPRLSATTPEQVAEGLRGIGLLGLVDVGVEDGSYLGHSSFGVDGPI